VLRDVVDTAERVGVPVRTAVRIRMATEDAILRQVRLGKHNLIVVGVARRPGEGLAFGEVADALLDTSDRSLLFLAS
jgi:nucleotide-binding universal stress UspA family protein